MCHCVPGFGGRMFSWDMSFLMYRWCLWTMWLQNVSRRSLGKILLSTLESCSDPHHGTVTDSCLSVFSKISDFLLLDHLYCFFPHTGKAHILEVLNALCHELAACEILSSSSTSENPQSHSSHTNSLLISCWAAGQCTEEDFLQRYVFFCAFYV